MACSEALTSDFNQMSWYRDKALSIMCVCKKKDISQFSEWLNRFEYVANIIHVPKEKMSEFFDIMVNDDIHKHVKRVNPRMNLRRLPYERKICHYLDIIGGPRINLHRRCFRNRYQYEKEPIKYYANCLQLHMKKGEYNKKNKKKILFKKFLNGLRKDVIRTYLSEIKSVSFEEMVAKAIEFEKVHLETYYRNHALLKIDIYNKEKEGEFNVWLNKFEYVADTIEVPESKIGKLFIEMVDNYINLNILLANPFDSVHELSYDKIINHYLRYFYPNEVELHRPRIFCRKQYEQETIENYAKSLKNLFNKCIFTIDLEEKLFEHFIYGLRENEVRNHLRETYYKSFDEMVVSAIDFAKVNLITYYRDRALLKIDIYNERNEGKFHVWLNKFEYVAYTIDVPECKMGKLFIEMIDNDFNQSVMEAYSCVDIYERSYDELIYLYLRFSFPKDRYLLRNSFKSRYQYEQEPTKTYVYFLRKYYEKSDLIKLSYFDLYKRFLNGLRENDTRNYLKKFPNFTFNESVEIAIEFEKVNLLSHYRDQVLLMINIYNPRKEGSFYNWLNGFNYVADKIDVPDNKKGKLLFEMIDNSVNQNVMQIFPSVKFSELSYNQIIRYYLSYFPPPREEH